MIQTILVLTAGLVLFLYAVSNLSSTLKQVLGENAKKIIQKYTSTVFKSVLVGTILTTLMDSSSAVIIISIIFVNSGLLTLRQAMGIVLGANVGTTVSSQIIAMNVSMYSPVFLFIGFVMMLFSKSDKVNNAGKVVLYFGILFFGLFTMENSVEPLKDHPGFMAWLRLADDPFKGSLIGAFVTLIIQSSSATVGMAIILLKKGFLSVSGGIAIMLGAELGTCSDTLLATIKGSRAALRTGVFHLLFNLTCILIGLFLFQPFTEFVVFISANAPVHRVLANAHMLFNFLGVLVFFPFVPLCEKAMIKLLPDK